MGSTTSTRLAALLAGAAQWRDPASRVRERAREALRTSEWPAQVVEAALDCVLHGADKVLRSTDIPDQAAGGSFIALAILPGNILGAAVAAAYCAAAAGAALMLKSPSRELHLADIVAGQFEELGPPLAGTLRAMRWTGGDVDFEAHVFPLAQRIVVFGDDETVDDVRRRAAGSHVIGYGSAYSIGFVPAQCDLAVAAPAAARDVAMFDQRGCLSPQTIYVEGDEARAILFAHTLSGALAGLSSALPRARAGEAEKAAVSEFLRRLQVRAIAPKTHALDTVLVGPNTAGTPDFVIGVEPYSAPSCAGFGRIVVVKPCLNAAQVVLAARELGARLDTIGVAVSSPGVSPGALSACGAKRVCAFGEMQRPPFGYRPKIADFASGRTL